MIEHVRSSSQCTGTQQFGAVAPLVHVMHVCVLDLQGQTCPGADSQGLQGWTVVQLAQFVVIRSAQTLGDRLQMLGYQLGAKTAVSPLRALQQC